MRNGLKRRINTLVDYKNIINKTMDVMKNYDEYNKNTIQYLNGIG